MDDRAMVTGLEGRLDQAVELPKARVAGERDWDIFDHQLSWATAVRSDSTAVHRSGFGLPSILEPHRPHRWARRVVKREFLEIVRDESRHLHQLVVVFRRIILKLTHRQPLH
jgi:hypothetical protein